MATIQTIATTLTADARPAITSLRTFDAEVGKAFTRLDAMNKRATASGGILGGQGGASGAFGSNATRGLLELSRGVEDAAVVFGTSGFSGAIRASSNNLSQMAMIMGGPLAGAVAGFAAAGLSVATPYIASLFDAVDVTKKLSTEIDNLINKQRSLFESRAKEAEGAIDLRQELRGGDDESALDLIKKRQAELKKVEAQEKALDVAPIAEGARAEQRAELLRKEAELRREINRLREAAPQEADALGESIEKRSIELEKLLARMKELDAARERNARFMVNNLPGGALAGEGRGLFGGDNAQQAAIKEREAKAAEEDSKLMQEKLELLRKETELRVQLGQLRRRELELTKEEVELQKQKDQDEFAGIIRKFQEEDQKQAEQDREKADRDAERKQEQQRRKEISDNERLENLLQSRIGQLGGKVDPLDDIKIPDRAGDLRKEREALLEKEGKFVDELEGMRGGDFDLERWKEIRTEMKRIGERKREIGGELDAAGSPLEGRLRDVLGEIDDLKNQKPAGLAQVATADSQSLARAQQIAKEAADRRRHEAALLAKLEKLIDEVKKARPPEDADADDVNLK